MSTVTGIRKSEMIALILQFEHCKLEDITTEMVIDISDKLDKTLEIIDKALYENSIPDNLPDNMIV